MVERLEKKRMLFEKRVMQKTMDFLALSKSCPLKAEQFPGTKTAFILDENGDVLARQMIVKYSPTQAYCIYTECSQKVAGKDIRVKEDEDTHHLRLVSIETERENRRLLPLFLQFHSRAEARPAEAHLIDHLAESTLGRFNLELKKNITHDSFAESDTWRDEAGFVVTDRNLFVYVTFSKSDLISTLQLSNCAKIAEYNAKDFEALCDFDASVCGFSREEAIESTNPFQFITSNSSVLLAKGNGGIDGMIAYKGNKVCFCFFKPEDEILVELYEFTLDIAEDHFDFQILALYAETLESAHSLIKHCIERNHLIQVSFFTRKDLWDCKHVSSRPVYRRHTRAVPSTIKWNKVYALNMGFQIV
ncbi:unnamed protein product [Angiostrongylus costaricensis]|uniref:N-acetyltransferase domain-containing protein n=1 Tax=Angiostrongylus costaricensis TaxID=334426 RepID=A0A0R3PJP8_ANGCS|nr:unnamed protein product [Angiostrongylus costaricensis]